MKERTKDQPETQANQERLERFEELRMAVGAFGTEAFKQRQRVNNLVRASRGQVALEAHLPADDPEAALIDHLTDLAHWADAVGVDYEAAVQWSRNHHQEEAALPEDGI